MADLDKDLTSLFVRDLDAIELPPREARRGVPRKESHFVKTTRYVLYGGAIAALLVIAFVASLVIRNDNQGASLPSHDPTPSATPTVTATPTASASPTSQGVYMSKKLGYALELPTPWHPAICGNSDPVDTRLPAGEQFTPAGPMDEFIGGIGSPNDRVRVGVEDNPQRLSPMEFAAGPSAVVVGPPRSVTFAGRPAVEVSQSGDEAIAYYVAEGERMYVVWYNSARSSSDPTPDRAAMLRILRSFRFVSESERQALPDPTPIPAAAPTAQALAGMLATAFQQRDLAALERLLSPCVTQGMQNAGGSAMTRQRYVDDLRMQFANGLTVTVDTNAIRTDPLGSGDTFVRSRWTRPDQLTRTVELIMGQTRGGLYWRGTFMLPS